MQYHHFLIFLLVIFFFILPVEFFVMGEGYGYGFKGYTYQYQITPQGAGLIPISYEVEFILDGKITGKSAISILFRIISILFYAIGLTIYLLTYDLKKSIFNRYCAGLISLSLLFVILSCITQYGIFFVGPAGISILIGVPFLAGICYYLYKFNPGSNQIENDMSDN